MIWSADCAGQELRIRLRVAPTFQNVYTTPYLDYGSYSAPIRLDDFKPYSPRAFGNAPTAIFDLREESYEAQGVGRVPLPRVVIFLDPKQVSPAEFKSIAACFEQSREEIAAAIRENAVLTRYHQSPFKVSGAVLGTYDQFVRGFKRNVNESVEVNPYGRAVVVQREGQMRSWMQVGEVIDGPEGPVLETSDTSFDPKLYKDASGRTLDQVFPVRRVKLQE